MKEETIKVCSNNDNLLNKKPVENVPPLTDELIQKIKAQPIPSARLVRNLNGATQLEINGNIEPFSFGTICLYTGEESPYVLKSCPILAE